MKLTQLRQEVMERRAMFDRFIESGLSERRALELVGSNVALMEPHRARARRREQPRGERPSNRESSASRLVGALVRLFLALVITVAVLWVMWPTFPDESDWPNDPALQSEYECLDTGFTPLDEE